MTNGLKEENMNKKSLNSSTLILVLFAFMNSSFGIAQNSECKKKLDAFLEFSKEKNFDKTTYQPWLELKNQCPAYDESIYLIGERILSKKIFQADASEAKNEMIVDLVSLYDEHDKNFPNNKNGNLVSKALLLFENKLATSNEIYSYLDTAFKTNYATFNDPNTINIYFNSAVSEFESNNKNVSLDQLIEKHNLISQKILSQTKLLSETKDRLTLKSQTEKLSTEEKSKLEMAKVTLREFAIVTKNANAKIDAHAKCSDLISFYKNNFEKNKDNSAWLESASERLNSKKCNDSLYKQITVKWNELSPSAKSAYDLALIYRKERDNKKVIEYFSQSAELQNDNIKKAELYYLIATTYGGGANKVEARNFIKKALSANPKLGKAYILLAQMYANGSQGCGANPFEEKAVYWLAAENAKQAGIVEPLIKKSADQMAAEYSKKAPSKDEISAAKRKAGQQITYTCWIDETVSIPKIK